MQQIKLEQIEFEQTKLPKVKPINQTKLGFGNVFTDHMFVMNYDGPRKWHSPRIIPYAPIALDPAAMCMHYAQEIFEGLKAFKTNDNRILLFRPQINIARLNMSNNRMCMPQIDENFCIDAIKKLVLTEKDWIPTAQGASLYLRPFIIAVDPDINIKPAKHLMFVIICLPVGAYYKNGITPIRAWVEQSYTRAAKGGIGFAKTGANCAASVKAKVEACEKGFDEVIWLDAAERKYIEQIGNMNAFFVIDDEIITPKLQESILPGITRDSAIQLLKGWGYKVYEREIAIDEIEMAYNTGKLKEAFATDTISVVSPVGEICLCEKRMPINNKKTGKIANRLYKTLTAIQYGEFPDHMGWTVEVK